MPFTVISVLDVDGKVSVLQFEGVITEAVKCLFKSSTISTTQCADQAIEGGGGTNTAFTNGVYAAAFAVLQSYFAFCLPNYVRTALDENPLQPPLLAHGSQSHKQK